MWLTADEIYELTTPTMAAKERNPGTNGKARSSTKKRRKTQSKTNKAKRRKM